LVLHHFFSDFSKTSIFLPKQECIGAFHPKLQYNYIFVCFYPTIEIIEFYPRRFLAAQLNNFEGRF
jgi:hypothetical protein